MGRLLTNVTGVHVRTETWGEYHGKMQDWSDTPTNQGESSRLPANHPKLGRGKDRFSSTMFRGRIVLPTP